MKANRIRGMFAGLMPRLLLIFTLLLTQLGGLSHGISHILAPQTQDQSLPHESHCDLCASYAQLGSAAPSTRIEIAAVSFVNPFKASQPFEFHTLSVAVFAARAPPGFA